MLVNTSHTRPLSLSQLVIHCMHLSLYKITRSTKGGGPRTRCIAYLASVTNEDRWFLPIETLSQWGWLAGGHRERAQSHKSVRCVLDWKKKINKTGMLMFFFFFLSILYIFFFCVLWFVIRISESFYTNLFTASFSSLLSVGDLSCCVCPAIQRTSAFIWIQFTLSWPEHHKNHLWMCFTNALNYLFYHRSSHSSISNQTLFEVHLQKMSYNIHLAD